MCKTYVFLFSLLLFVTKWGNAQVQTGGNIGINYINNVFIGDFAPEISYRFYNNMTAGISPFVLYAKNMSTNESQYLFGVRAFGEYRLDAGIFAHVEYEISDTWNSEGWGKMVQSAPLGGGYEQELSSNTIAYVMVLYDILYDVDFSYKSNPIIRAGVRYSF